MLFIPFLKKNFFSEKVILKGGTLGVRFFKKEKKRGSNDPRKKTMN